MDNETLTAEEIELAVEKIFKLSQTDAEFRALCLSSPLEAIRQVTGKSPPPDFRIRFVDPGQSGASSS